MELEKIFTSSTSNVRINQGSMAAKFTLAFLATRLLARRYDTSRLCLPAGVLITLPLPIGLYGTLIERHRTDTPRISKVYRSAWNKGLLSSLAGAAWGAFSLMACHFKQAGPMGKLGLSTLGFGLATSSLFNLIPLRKSEWGTHELGAKQNA